MSPFEPFHIRTIAPITTAPITITSIIHTSIIHTSIIRTSVIHISITQPPIIPIHIVSHIPSITHTPITNTPRNYTTRAIDFTIRSTADVTRTTNITTATATTITTTIAMTIATTTTIALVAATVVVDMGWWSPSGVYISVLIHLHYMSGVDLG